jgi:hypothetical protein
MLVSSSAAHTRSLRHSSGVNVKRIILTFGSPPFGRGDRPSSGFMLLSLRLLAGALQLFLEAVHMTRRGLAAATE